MRGLTAWSMCTEGRQTQILGEPHAALEHYGLSWALGSGMGHGGRRESDPASCTQSSETVSNRSMALPSLLLPFWT